MLRRRVWWCLAALGASALRPPAATGRRAGVVRRASFEAGVTASGERVCVVGATGYIGKFVVQECVRRGYPTTAVVRSTSSAASPYLASATVVEAEATDREALEGAIAESGGTDVVICCLASRSGSESDSLLVDYEASVNCLEVARRLKARHFVLLSAFCVAKPWLKFQDAKLKTEAALAAQSDVSYSIVRPTAFFKSVSGQVEIVKGGGPFVYFDLGEGRSATCNPIAEADLAMALVDCVCDPTKSSKTGTPIWNLGGPDAGYSMRQQADLIADAIADVDAAPRKDPWVLGVPIGLFDLIIGSLDFFAQLTNSQKWKDAAEFGRIGKYYAVEDMLTTQPAEKYGRVTLFDHYKRVVRDGQEYDPYTTVFAKGTAVAAKQGTTKAAA